jgi:hypothetical protein
LFLFARIDSIEVSSFVSAFFNVFVPFGWGGGAVAIPV